jgi:hypothetical protein
MKLSQFKSLIKEEVNKILNEAPKEKAAEVLKFDRKKLTTYPVGNGKRKGMPVKVDLLKKVISSIARKNIKTIENTGVTFTQAYVNMPTQYAASFDSEGKTILTYSLLGRDRQGNEIIYDKYDAEEGLAGFGQTFVFVNGKKQLARSYDTPNKVDVANFLSSITGLPADDEDNGILVNTLKSNKVEIILGLDIKKLSTLEKIYNSLLKNKSKLKAYFDKYSLPSLSVALDKEKNGYTLIISNVIPTTLYSLQYQKSFDI